MPDYQLFYGIPVDKLLSEELTKINPTLKAIFIQSNSDYLQEITFKDKKYLGKFVGKICSLQSLELFENNIYSLLDKIVPEYPFRQQPIVLFPIEQE